MNKFTSGPWTYYEEDNIIVSEEVSQLIDIKPRSTIVGLEERIANGYLIATAPELLEAVNWLKCTLLSALAGACIRDADEVISFAERVVAKAMQE